MMILSISQVESSDVVISMMEIRGGPIAGSMGNRLPENAKVIFSAGR